MPYIKSFGTCPNLVLKYPFFQSEPEIEYYLPELQAAHSSVANKPWPEGNPQTQRLQTGEMKHHKFTELLKQFFSSVRSMFV